MNYLQNLQRNLTEPNLSYQVGKLEFAPSYLQAGAVILLLFLLVLVIARVRYLYVNWNLGRSAFSMLVWGFLIAVILEGFLLLGGRTIFTEILGWEKAPKPISNLLDIGRNKMVNVLGVTDEIPSSMAKEKPTMESVLLMLQGLSQEDQQKLKASMCQP